MQNQTANIYQSVGGRHKKACCRPSILAVDIHNFVASVLVTNSYKDHLRMIT